MKANNLSATGSASLKYNLSQALSVLSRSLSAFAIATSIWSPVRFESFKASIAIRVISAVRVYDRGSVLARGVDEKLPVSTVINFTLKRLDGKDHEFFFGQMIIAFAGGFLIDCLLEAEDQRGNSKFMFKT